MICESEYSQRDNTALPGANENVSVSFLVPNRNRAFSFAPGKNSIMSFVSAFIPKDQGLAEESLPVLNRTEVGFCIEDVAIVDSFDTGKELLADSKIS